MALAELGKDTGMTNSHYNILLVDDEEAVLKSLRRTLRNSDYKIYIFTEPQAALLEAEHRDYDLVISDYRMPRMDGVSFLRKLIVLQPEIRRIMLSGYSDMRAVMAAINEVGIYKFLTKPWKDAELRQIVADSLIKDKHSALQSKPLKAANQMGALAELEMRYPGITEGIWSANGDAQEWKDKF